MKGEITYRGVDQHQREDEETCTPKHEGQAGLRSGCAVDRDRERNHIWPERDRQRAESGRENKRHHVERGAISAINDVVGEYQRSECAGQWKGKQDRSLEPAMHNLQVLCESVDEHDDEKYQ